MTRGVFLNVELTITFFMLYRPTVCEGSTEYDIFKKMTDGYDKNIRPSHNSSIPTWVSLELMTFNLLNMNQPEETITFLSELQVIWKDDILHWNTSLFGGVETVVVPDAVWKPDIVISTGLHVDYLVPQESRFVEVDYIGIVRSSNPCVITNQCLLTINDFPFDVQQCQITMGSWMYSSDQIDLKIGNQSEYVVGDPFMKGNGEWRLLSMEPFIEHYEDGERNYAQLSYMVRFKRQPIYYICVLLIPTYITATLCLLGLFVPSVSTGERQEKVDLGLATLLSMAVILGIVADEMPKTTTLPLLGFYVLAEILLCTVGVGVSILISFAHQRSHTRHLRPPSWLLRLVRFQWNCASKHKYEKVNAPICVETATQTGENAEYSTVVGDQLKGFIRTIEDHIDAIDDDEHMIELWHLIFDRIDLFFLFAFQLCNLIMSALLLAPRP